MPRVILHSDLNSFYASVEILRRPELKEKPVAVCGSSEDRHGIVLAANGVAKKYGVRTGDVIWQARSKCENLVCISADFSAYLRVSAAVRGIYERYTDLVEAYGIDECWLDVTDSAAFGSGVEIAEEIRRSVKREIGVTVSVGVSWNKIFAKLGSDMRKPDAVTEITAQNYREIVWKLPVEDLLYVGKATKRKLHFLGISTIGALANADVDLLFRELGKWGVYLRTFANGNDLSPVRKREEARNVVNLGNSLTCYRDLETEDDVAMLFLLLADSVADRLRESGLGKAGMVKIFIRDNALAGYAKQGKLPPVRTGKEIADAAMRLFRAAYSWERPVRALGVSVAEFTRGAEQLSLFSDRKQEEKDRRLEEALACLKEKYGNNIIQRATVLKDKRLSSIDIKGEHVIHPESFF